MNLQELIEKVLKQIKEEAAKKAADKIKDEFSDKVKEPILETFNESETDETKKREAATALDYFEKKLGAVVEDSIESLTKGENPFQRLPRSLSDDLEEPVISTPRNPEFTYDFGRPRLGYDSPSDVLENGFDPTKVELIWKPFEFEAVLDNGDEIKGEINLEGKEFLDRKFRFRGGEWNSELELTYYHYPLKEHRESDLSIIQFKCWVRREESKWDYGFSIGGEIRF